MHSTQVDFRVAGLDCEDEAQAIARGLRGFPGVVELHVYPQSARVVLTYDPDRTSPDALKAQLTALGFPAHEGA